jgi:hypothetical protein
MREVDDLLRLGLAIPSVSRVAFLRWGAVPIVVERNEPVDSRGLADPVDVDVVWRNALTALAEGGSFISRASNGLVILQVVSPGSALLAEVRDASQLGVAAVKLAKLAAKIRVELAI